MLEDVPDTAPRTNTASNGTASANGATPAPAGDWRVNLIPKELQSDPLWGRFKTPDAFFKSYAEMNKLQSRSLGSKVPDDNSTPEERRAFYTKIGVPEKPEDYQFQRPEGVPIDENLESWFRKASIENGVPKATAEKLYAGFVEQVQGLMDNASAQVSKFKDDLKKEWGYATDRNVRIASNTLGHLIALSGGTPNQDHPLVKFLNETHLGDHPALIRFFHSLAAKFGEDQLIEPDVGPSVEDVESAKQELAEIMKPKAADGKTKSPYWQGDKAAVARAQQLREIINSSR